MPSDTLAAFGCSTCSTPLGFTAPGEAKRIGQRARIYCGYCKDAPEALTPRQEQFVELSLAYRKATGTKPPLTVLADQMDVSRSRAQQLRDVIARRRPGLLDGPVPTVEAAYEIPGIVVVPATSAVRFGVGTDGNGQPVTEADQAAWRDDPKIIEPVVTAANPEDLDPASAGGEFV